VSSRSARSNLLAAGAGVGVIAGVLRVVATSLAFADLFSFPIPVGTWLKVASGFDVLAWVFVVAAFGVALAGFLVRSRRTRATVLAVSAGLFAGCGVSLLAYALIELVQQWGYGLTWTYRASGCAEAAAGLSVAVAGVLVAIGFLSSRPDGLLGWGAIGLAGHFGLLATAYSFALAEVLTVSFGAIPGEISWGLGTHAGGQLLVAAGAVVASVAFFRSNGRRKRGEPWQARRESSLGVAAVVIAVGFLVGAVGLMLLASRVGGDGRHLAEYWLQAVAELLLAGTATCGAVGFFLSRSGLEQRDGPDTAALPDPG
jgi:hypothetical protein